MPTRSATASEKRLCYGFSLARGVELALLSSDAVFWAPSGSRTPNDAFNLVFIATLAVLFGMLALIAHRKTPGGLPLWAYVKAAPVATTCGICILAARGSLLGELWTCVAGILCGAGSALLFLGWQVWFASNGSTCDTRTMGKAFVGAPVVALLILLMGFPIGTVSSAVALWASAFILETSFAKTSPSNGGIRDLDMPWKNTSTLTLARELASPLGALLIFALVFGIGGQISFNSIDSAASFLLTNVVGIGGALVAGLIFMAFGHIVGGKTHSEEIYRWVAPVVITAVAALPFAGPWYGILLNAVIVVSYYLMNYNYLCFIARGAHAGEWEPTVVASASQAAIRLTMLVGIIGGSTFLANWEASSLAKSAILALAVVYLLSMGLFRSRSKLNNPHDVTANVPRHTVEPVAPPTEPSMASLCTLYLLTDREGEVLAHLVNGYSVKLIAEELGVSPNTVRTHIRSLYDKMDIHNKDDLVRFYRSYVKINERATTI